MGELIGAILGLALAAFGFIVMRNPIRMTILSPWLKGYYQHVVLDTALRNQLRMVGAVLCLFGASIFTFVMSWITKAASLHTIAQGIWVLMNCVFWVAFCLGLILTIRQLIQGQFEWFRMWRRGAQLGLIDVLPPATPAMRKEAEYFTAALLASVFIAVLVSLFR